jgi:glycosyltransferase involved in cell wall biosynthesis
MGYSKANSLLPLVSVIIPNYNHALFLKQRIDSVLNQTFADFEIILLDDCSIDESNKIIEQYRENKKVSHIVYNDKNSGSTFKQWNKGIALACGKYIWIAESDDFAADTLLETLVHQLETNDCVIAFCQSYKVNANNEVTGSWLDFTDDLDSKLFRSDFCIPGHQFIQKFLVIRNALPNASAVLFTKAAFYKAGLAEPEIRYAADWLMWLKMLTAGGICYVSAMLNYFRYHSNSVIAQAQQAGITKFTLPFDIKMRIDFNRFMRRSKDKTLKNIKSANATLLCSEAIISTNHFLACRQYVKAFHFFRIAIWHAESVVYKKKVAGLLINNFFNAISKKNTLYFI